MKKQSHEFGFKFDNTYLRLPDVFYSQLNPTPVQAPKTALFNFELAQTLGLIGATLASEKAADCFSGNALLPGAQPLAQAYAGHQFGHFNMLGDGRAILLGEHVTPDGERFDVQLKGSGPTPFSRRGDGRAALGPMLREYIISEAMQALGIPTTRSLAVVTTGELVYREKPAPGAVLTRIARSHLRVGTFEFAAATGKIENLRALADYTLERHHPDLKASPEPYLALLTAVIEKQASLVAQWMLVGFIHGVMNTDNMSLAGETIDYGPCAFMNEFSVATVFSSIDHQGRYAYGNQPQIADWNLTRFAESLLPLLAEKEEEAIAKAEEALAIFVPTFERHWLGGLRAKLGLASESSEDVGLIETLMRLMEAGKADYTNTFRALCSETLPDEPFFKTPELVTWHKQWLSRNPSFALMRTRNPVVIPRNHKVEEALSAAVERDDYSVLERLLTALGKPFDDTPENQAYRTPPSPSSERYQTFCGT